MISSNRVSEVQKAVSSFNIFDGIRFQGSFLEERGVMNISGFFFPLVLFTLVDWKGIPSVSSFSDSGVDFIELLAFNRVLSNLCDLVSGGPNVFKEYIVSIFILSNWLFFEVNVDSSSQSISNNQGRTC